MNAERRKAITQVMIDVQKAANDLEGIRDAEQTAFDNLSEGQQEGEKGEAMTTWIEGLETAIENLGAVVEDLGAME